MLSAPRLHEAKRSIYLYRCKNVLLGESIPILCGGCQRACTDFGVRDTGFSGVTYQPRKDVWLRYTLAIMLSLSCRKTLKRKLLSGAIFGAASSLFFACFFVLFGSDSTSSFDLYAFILTALPAATIAFLVAPGADKHIEDCSKEDSLLAGAGITALTYLSSLTLLFFHSVTETPPNNFIGFIELLNDGLALAWIGAWLMLLPALPFGMFGGWLYRRLAKRTLSTN